MNFVKQFMVKTWNFIQLPNLFYNDECYFILRFKSFEDKDTILMNMPYTIRSMPIMLMEWMSEFNLKQVLLCILPIWVKLPQLPLHLWGSKSLTKIGSTLGTPLVTNECTANKFRVSYVRILVEVDVTQDLIKEVTIKDRDGGKLKHAIEYEWCS